MNRCGITRKDGVVRIGILCDRCATKALQILTEAERGFWAKEYTGDKSCEACYLDEQHFKKTKEKQ